MTNRKPNDKRLMLTIRAKIATPINRPPKKIPRFSLFIIPGIKNRRDSETKNAVK